MNKILDEFTDLPISRQRRRQLRLKRDGLCIICGKPAINASHCQLHADAAVRWTKRSNLKYWAKRKVTRAIAHKVAKALARRR